MEIKRGLEGRFSDLGINSDYLFEEPGSAFTFTGIFSHLFYFSAASFVFKPLDS
jgi:hypothetical protein